MEKIEVDFNKQGGLVPAIVQDAETKNVLMLGYMNQESLYKTVETGYVTSSAVADRNSGPKERKVATS